MTAPGNLFFAAREFDAAATSSAREIGSAR